MIEELEDALHALDRELDELRRRAWMVRHGMIESADPEAEAAELESRFRELSERFIETYRAWSHRHAEE